MSTNWNQVESIFKHLVVGDSARIECEVHNVPTGEPITQAWLTVKATLDDLDPGIFQKTVTTTPTMGQGVITAGSCFTLISFDVLHTDTGQLNPSQQYFYDIQAKVGDKAITTLEVGAFRPLDQITLAS